jgi:AcrR family transcriptional regulator
MVTKLKRANEPKAVNRLELSQSIQVSKKVSPKIRTKREQRDLSIEAILTSALQLFIRKGYRSTTVEQIATACSLTKGAVYFYFPNKAAVLFALFDEIEDLMINKMAARVAHAGPSMKDKLVALINSQSQMGLENAERMLLFILMLLEFNGADDDVETRVKAIYKRYYKAIEKIIQQGKIKGEFRSDVDVKSMSGIMMAINNGTMMEWYCRSGEHSGRELARAGRVIALSGVLKNAHS